MYEHLQPFLRLITTTTAHFNLKKGSTDEQNVNLKQTVDESIATKQFANRWEMELKVQLPEHEIERVAQQITRS